MIASSRFIGAVCLALSSSVDSMIQKSEMENLKLSQKDEQNIAMYDERMRNIERSKSDGQYFDGKHYDRFMGTNPQGEFVWGFKADSQYFEHPDFDIFNRNMVARQVRMTNKGKIERCRITEDAWETVDYSSSMPKGHVYPHEYKSDTDQAKHKKYIEDIKNYANAVKQYKIEAQQRAKEAAQKTQSANVAKTLREKFDDLRLSHMPSKARENTESFKQLNKYIKLAEIDISNKRYEIRHVKDDMGYDQWSEAALFEYDDLIAFVRLTNMITDEPECKLFLFLDLDSSSLYKQEQEWKKQKDMRGWQVAVRKFNRELSALPYVSYEYLNESVSENEHHNNEIQLANYAQFPGDISGEIFDVYLGSNINGENCYGTAASVSDIYQRQVRKLVNGTHEYSKKNTNEWIPLEEGVKKERHPYKTKPGYEQRRKAYLEEIVKKKDFYGDKVEAYNANSKPVKKTQRRPVKK